MRALMSAFIREEEEVRLGNKRLINVSSRAATIFTQSGVGWNFTSHAHNTLWK
jgi:hypothetical protein